MNKKRNQRKAKRPFYKKPGLYLFLLFCVVAGVVALVLFYNIYLKDFRERALTQYDYSKVDDVQIPSQIFDRNGQLIGRSYEEENRSLVTIEEIPSALVNALLAQEDQRFWVHKGVDWKGVLRAVYLNAKAGETTQGASTITMQLARNAFDLQEEAKERGESGIERKIVEAFVALEIERRYVGEVEGDERLTNKRKLLEMYLNRVPFGKGYYGVRAAALGYFGKEPEDLTLSECASLVACIKNPSLINPISNPEINKVARNHVFTRMFAEGTIPTKEEYDRLVESPVVTNPRPLRRGTSHLYNKVVELTRSIVGDDAMSRGGFSIYTTIDKATQDAAHRGLREQLLEIENREGYRHPLLAGFDKDKDPQPEYLRGAVLMIDSSTGAVIAHVGGRQFAHSQYDFIESGRRPTGTAFLPVVYAAAFENRFSPATLLSDLPMDAREVALGGTEGILGEWGPEMMDPVYEGDITTRKALRDSKIAATVRLGVEVGIDTVARQARTFGLTLESGEMLPRLLLGWEQNSLWRLTRAYASFGRNGQAPEEPYYIESIRDIEGNEVYRAPRTKTKTVTFSSPETAYQIHSILSDSIQHGNLRENAAQLTEPEFVTVKTGTNHNFSDAWTFGYNGKVTCGVWVGFLSGREPIYDYAFAKDTAFPIWAQTMNAAAGNFPGQKLAPPAGLAAVSLCERSGRRLTRYCYDSVFDPEHGLSLASTSYQEYLRPEQAEVGVCVVHGKGGVTPSEEFAPDTEDLRQRQLNVPPLTVRSKALTGQDPYGALIPEVSEEPVPEPKPEPDLAENETPTEGTENESVKEPVAPLPEDPAARVRHQQEFTVKESRQGEREATIRLRPPQRIEISDDL
ncbi:transglycosylase domain-containing protein [Roseibacillus ishigakijimensis]|uniref:Transglycosylase domain-containing protein n=1 Tax=Roseibacillus ishigakijimensis TaxID=454146 RepID=A0A934RNQ8_9BACT|nr:transglycosylase domain-containing protein [Roseibacillus ishigakijimensis]MBK1834188.1 transglycosylase domain-containing protein [Roseibacillus ishigakijimensis]